MKSTGCRLACVLSLGAVLLGGCTTSTPCAPQTSEADSPYGNWSLQLPFERMFAGHLILERTSAGETTALLLWRYASPTPAPTVMVEGPAFTVIRAFNKPRGKENDPSAWRALKVWGTVKANAMQGSFCTVDGSGKAVTKVETFTGWRNPPMCAAPDLAKLAFGAPVNLLAGTFDEGFEMMEKNAACGWTLKDGVLSNRIRRNADGSRATTGPHNGNLRTRRADFHDFKLSYDVRVLKGCNSGVYLRGRYEIQVVDSYGQKPDCHSMAAYYGRVAPSVAAEKPAGEWQHVDVILAKRHLTVELNGRKIIDNVPITGVTGGAIDADDFKPGPIYLQGDHSDADFKNMILTPCL